MENIVEVKDVIKSYNGFKLDINSLNIPKGNIVGLIGENGAGKTTLLKAILGIIKTDSGNIKVIDNKDIGIVLDDSFFPEILQVKDIDAIMKKVYDNWDRELFFNYLKEFNLKKNKAIKNLSKGMKKKLEIATALSHHPKLLILDEPTSGLDPLMRSEVLDLFLKFIEDENNSILLSTHITSDLEHIADKIVFINKGKIILDISRDDLMDNYGILKCSKEDFENIDNKDIIAYRKNRYGYAILIDDKKKMEKKYKNCIIDRITVDDLMILILKGEKKWLVLLKKIYVL